MSKRKIKVGMRQSKPNGEQKVRPDHEVIKRRMSSRMEDDRAMRGFIERGVVNLDIRHDLQAEIMAAREVQWPVSRFRKSLERVCLMMTGRNQDGSIPMKKADKEEDEK